MNPTDQDRWKSVVLDAVLEALASSPALAERLVFKGARVLNLHLGAELRQSLDIDSNLTMHFAAEVPDRNEQARILQVELQDVIATFFRRQDPIRFQLAGLSVRSKMNRPHPRGWDAFEVRLNVFDSLKPRVLGLPVVTIDIAAPETLLDDSTVVLAVGNGHITGYSLKRIAGEKLRAYLSSLPTYRTKLDKPGEAIRAKDLYDIARILRTKPLPASTDFWQAASAEFVVCCRSRFVDCLGIASFEEDLAVARETYDSDPTIPKDIPFGDALACVTAVVQFFDDQGLFPLHFPLAP